MMRTVDETRVRAPVDAVFAAAADVERWPAFLPHYRRVTMLDGDSRRGVVEMAAWRPFGPFNYPTWWVSEMASDPAAATVRYRHVRGITTGMDVQWNIVGDGAGSRVTIIHEWRGPRWPLIGRAAAEWVIGPVFIHGIASRTLAGIKRQVERAERPQGA